MAKHFKEYDKKNYTPVKEVKEELEKSQEFEVSQMEQNQETSELFRNLKQLNVQTLKKLDLEINYKFGIFKSMINRFFNAQILEDQEPVQPQVANESLVKKPTLKRFQNLELQERISDLYKYAFCFLVLSYSNKSMHQTFIDFYARFDKNQSGVWQKQDLSNFLEFVAKENDFGKEKG